MLCGSHPLSQSWNATSVTKWLCMDKMHEEVVFL